MTWRVLRVVLLSCLVVGPAACEPLDDAEPPEEAEPPDPPDPPDPTKSVGPIQDISPKTALLGQKLTVTIKLGGEPAGPGTDVSFGVGVDVVKLTEVPGGVAVDIVVEDDAVTGTRDVTVTPDDAPMLSAPRAFTIASAMDVTVKDGKPEQGGLVRLGVNAKSGQALAPATFLLDSLADAGTPTLFQIARGAFTASSGEVVMLGDPLAKTGPLDLLGSNNPDDPNAPAFFAAAAVDVAARAPVALTSGAPSNVTLSNVLGTAFYSVDLAPQGGEGLLVDAIANLPGGSTLKPIVYAYPASGKLDDLLEASPVASARIGYPVTAATKGFFVVFDRDFASAPTKTLSFDFKTYRASVVAEQAAPHPQNTPQNLGALPAPTDPIPGRIITGNLGGATEVDAYVLSGFPTGADRDVQVSVMSDVDIDVLIDHVAAFNDDPVTINVIDRSASAVTFQFRDPNRYIKVVGAGGAKSPTGKYTIGIRAVN